MTPSSSASSSKWFGTPSSSASASGSPPSSSSSSMPSASSSISMSSVTPSPSWSPNTHSPLAMSQSCGLGHWLSLVQPAGGSTGAWHSFAAEQLAPVSQSSASKHSTQLGVASPSHTPASQIGRAHV